MNQAIEQTRIIRLRPILMTALVAGLGFVPMAMNTGVESEVQRRLATVVIGGIIADNLLTLFVLPALYWLVGGRDLRSGAKHRRPDHDPAPPLAEPTASPPQLATPAH